MKSRFSSVFLLTTSLKVLFIRCHICNAVLPPDGVSYSKDHEEFNPCGTCLMEIKEVFTDHLDEDEIEYTLLEEDDENLEDTDVLGT